MLHPSLVNVFCCQQPLVFGNKCCLIYFHYGTDIDIDCQVYEEPPPDLWVNAHTEMAILPPASSSTASAIPVDNIAPFVPG